MTRNDIKYSKLEEDGVEYLGPIEHIPTAQDIAFTDPDFFADNVLDGITESALRGINAAAFPIMLSAVSTVKSGDYLDIFPSGSSEYFPFPIISDTIVFEVGLRTKTAATCTIGIYKLVSGTEVEIATVSLSNEIRKDVPGLSIDVWEGQDILGKVISGQVNSPAVAVMCRRES
jgi:hypothetical protein